MWRKFFSIAILLVILTLSVSYIIKYHIFESELKPEIAGNLKEAEYYEKLGGGVVQCQLCPRFCVLNLGETGICRVRKNIKGKLYSLVYGQPVSIHLDPIEKKPLFHFLPGSTAYSVATAGCNLRCLYCQNWEISQAFPEDVQSVEKTPQQLVEEALNFGAESIAYTYTEPTVFFEYMLETAKLAKQKGLKNVVISAGYINPEPLKELCQYVDAIKIDLKAFNNGFYKKIVGGELEPVLNTLKTIKEQGVWLEIVYLVIPGENDDPEEIRQMSQWIKKNLGEDVPLHFSRFHPMYKLINLPPTPEQTVRDLRKIALEQGLKYVYTGNLGDWQTESTYCPGSQEMAIERKGYFVTQINFNQGLCANGEQIPGIWK
ncbi:AmmeMemoRadiSam system radical SAM enzyme [Patescibacteria group bacterium]|nr:AmmeMemoRadiSam system radical SAM enzyme [Patescibacteria group bacterium]